MTKGGGCDNVEKLTKHSKLVHFSKPPSAVWKYRKVIFRTGGN